MKCLLIAMAVFQTAGLLAQSNVGLRAGIHLATITEVQDLNSPGIDPEYITGMNFAVFSEFNLTENFAIQPEITFLQKGSEVVVKDLEDQADFGVKAVINYLEVPVLAKYKFGVNRVKGFAMLGPSVGYALGGKGTYTIHNVKETEKIEFDKDYGADGMKDQRWDIGAVAAAGGMLAVGPGHLIMDLRYGMDFTDFTKFKDSAPADHEKSYNRGFGISLGYQVPIIRS